MYIFNISAFIIFSGLSANEEDKNTINNKEHIASLTDPDGALVSNNIDSGLNTKKQYEDTINNEEGIVLLVDLDKTLISSNINKALCFAMMKSRKFYYIPVIMVEYLFGSTNTVCKAYQAYINSYPDHVQEIIQNLKFNDNIIDVIKTRKINCKIYEAQKDGNNNNNDVELNGLSIEIPQNKKVVLVLSSGSPQLILDAVAKHIETNAEIKFDHVIGSTRNIMNIGETKLQTLKDIMGDKKYSVIYFGDNAKKDQDLAIFKQDNVIPMFVRERSDRDADLIVKEISNQFGKDMLYLPSTYQIFYNHNNDDQLNDKMILIKI